MDTWPCTNSSCRQPSPAAPRLGGLMDDPSELQDQYSIQASPAKATERTSVLQHDDTFAVFDLQGDMGALETSEQGLYHEGTRYISKFLLRLNGRRPLLLSSRVRDDNQLFGA